MHGQEWKVANKMTPLFPSFQSETMWFIHLKLVVHVCCLTLKSCKLIYTLWPEVCGHSNITLMWLLNFSFKNTGHQFAVVTASTPLRKKRKGFWKPGCMNLLPFNHKGSSEVMHWCCLKRPGSQLTYNSSQRWWIWCWASFHTKLEKTFHYADFVCRGILITWVTYLQDDSSNT